MDKNEQAFHEAIELESAGNIIPALSRYSFAYHQGNTSAGDKLNALFKTYSFQAKIGDYDAQLYLAIMYAYGYGVQADDERAVYWYEKAICSDKADAFFYYGEYFELLKDDEETAYLYYLEAAKRGSPEAYDALGTICKWQYDESGDLQDLQKSIDYYSEGVSLGEINCAYHLAVIYLEVLPDNTKNSEEAFRLLQLADSHSYKEAIPLLADCYNHAIGTKRNPEKAFEYFFKDAEINGGSRAAQKLADCYRLGIGTERNVPEAVKWYNKALEYHPLYFEEVNIKARLAELTACDDPSSVSKVVPIKQSPSMNKKLLSPKEDSIQSELDSLIGLDSIKEDIKNLISFIKVQHAREAKGYKAIPFSQHLVFSGNPGTGKTTVARILAKAYKEIGLLKTGQLVEVSRVDLVASYVGQTAPKTTQKINEAMGGILFIDEAYMLVNRGSEDYGQEAIDTLLKQMEDHRDEFVVIVAGYPNLMEQFINSNPGLKSRFNKVFLFPDYNSDELFRIFCSMCEKYDLSLTDDAKKAALNQLIILEEKKDANFANARDVRNFFEKILERQARRIALSANINEIDIMQIIEDDIVSIK